MLSNFTKTIIENVLNIVVLLFEERIQSFNLINGDNEEKGLIFLPLQKQA